MEEESQPELMLVDLRGLTKVAFIDLPPLTDSEIKDMFIEKLNNFYVLEKLLKDEGLI